MGTSMPGQIIILNGASRAGKSSIASAIQEDFDGVWMNLGVDLFAGQATPSSMSPRMRAPASGSCPSQPPQTISARFTTRSPR